MYKSILGNSRIRVFILVLALVTPASPAVQGWIPGAVVTITDENGDVSDHFISRDEFVSTFIQAVNKTAKSYHNAFDDVSKDNGFSCDMQAAKDLKIIPDEMIADNHFFPDRLITREEATVILIELFGKLRGYHVPELSVEGYADRKEMSSWAVSRIESAIDFGLMAPAAPDHFRPKANMTREEMEKIKCDFLDVMSTIDIHTLIWNDIPIDEPHQSGKTIQGTDFGMSESSPDNYQALTDALAYCKTNHIYKLLIPKGIYRFDTAKPIYLDDMQDFILDGQGSEFLMSNVDRANSQGHYLHVRGGERIIIKNLSFDWDDDRGRMASLGVVTAVRSDVTFEMEFPEVEVMKREDLMLHSLGSYNLAEGYWGDPADDPDYDMWSRKWTIGEQLTSNKYVITTNHPGLYADIFKVGQAYLIRHYEYNFHGVVVHETKHLLLDAVNVFSVAGHGFNFAKGARYWKMINCKNTIKSGANRHIASNTDALHVNSPGGYYQVENCELNFTGDDCTNIYRLITNQFTRVPEKSNAIEIMRQAWRFPVEAGDVLEFRHNDMHATGFSSKVFLVTSRGEAGDGYYVELENDIPSEIVEGVLLNQTYSAAHYVFRNNTFIGNKVRGSLLHEGFALVEGNYFADNGRSNILFTNGIARWSEGFDLDNMIFRNNTLKNPNLRNKKDSPAAIFFETNLQGVVSTDYPIFRNISFENNTFHNFHPRAFYIRTANNLKIRNNTFSISDDYRFRNHIAGSFDIAQSKNIYISDNEWIYSDKFKNDSDIIIHIDDRSTENIIRQMNKVVQKKKQINQNQ